MLFYIFGYQADQYDFTAYACLFTGVHSGKIRRRHICASVFRNVCLFISRQFVQLSSVLSVLLYYDAYIDRNFRMEGNME